MSMVCPPIKKEKAEKQTAPGIGDRAVYIQIGRHTQTGLSTFGNTQKEVEEVLQKKASKEGKKERKARTGRVRDRSCGRGYKDKQTQLTKN